MHSVAVVGLGYVGLPLAVAFGRKIKTIGFDLSESKIENYRNYCDPTGEVSNNELETATHLHVTTDASRIAEADYVVVAVPTPIDETRRPDLSPLVSASTTVGQNIKKGAVIIFESTVYPGATEEVCVPILEKESGLKWKDDFFIGYSPERINPGDKVHRLETIVKVVAGDSDETLEKVAQLYELVIDAGVYRASTIKVAEAAKVIENTQRDLNISLMNELAIIFDRLGIDTLDVLEAAGTKWNFLNFRPGLVGGHCIGVDPYYLTHKAEMTGYQPQVILAGRRINDGMGKYIAEKTVKRMIAAGSSIKGAKVILLGLTFKEDCPDLRNSRVIDVIDELETYGIDVSVHDASADSEEAEHEYGVSLKTWDELEPSAAVIVAVAHEMYRDMPAETMKTKFDSAGACFIDVKSLYNNDYYAQLGVDYWRL